MATPKLSFDKGPRQYYARFHGNKVYFGADSTETLVRYQAEAPSL